MLAEYVLTSMRIFPAGRQGSFGHVLPSVVPFPLIEGTTLYDPFPFLVRLLTLARKVVHSINDLEEPARTDALAALQQELVDIGSLMPNELQFSIQNLQPYVLVGKSTGFIFMHVSRKRINSRPPDRATDSLSYSYGFIRERTLLILSGHSPTNFLPFQTGDTFLRAKHNKRQRDRRSRGRPGYRLKLCEIHQ